MARNSRKSKPSAKQAVNRRKGVSPINGVEPPPEHRWQKGQPSPNPHGRPRKLADLQALILSTLAEETHDAEGRRTGLTRAQMLIRTMLIKSPSDRIALLEYAFGKMPQPTRDLSGDEWRTWLIENGFPNPDELIDEFISHMGSRRDSARSVPAAGGEGAAVGGASGGADPTA